MLLSLSVENYILIRHLDLGFKEGFTCITGETGAGKSILIGALGLILGQRADTQVLLDKGRKCIVEGSFALKGYDLEGLFEKYDIDYDDVTSLRREITPQGKSRAFINDTPVNLPVLKELGEQLVDIHSQNQTLELNGALFQLAMVDSYADNNQELSRYRDLFHTYQSMKQELDECIAQENKASLDREYLEFQLDELSRANLVEDEQEESEQELEILSHAEEIKNRLLTALQHLEDSEDSILSKLAESRSSLEQASRFGSQLENVSQRFGSLYIEIKEITRELRDLEAHISHDPERILALSQRLDLIYHLQQKHKVSSVNELIKYQSDITDRLNTMSSLGERIGILKNELEKTERGLEELSHILTAKRNQAIPRIESDMESVLSELGMPSSRFQIQRSEIERFTKEGKDKVSFIFAANRGGELREIQKVASGGELSRLMLAIKSLVIQRKMLPTVLFDEIDSMGGVINAIENGYFQKEIADAAYRYQKELDKKEKIIVGINEFVEKDEKIEIPILQISKDVELKQKNRLIELKSSRNSAAVEQSLKDIEYAVLNNQNLMPVFIKAAHNYVTLGEMVETLKKHFGIYEETLVF